MSWRPDSEENIKRKHYVDYEVNIMGNTVVPYKKERNVLILT